MITILIEYAEVSPAVLAHLVERACPMVCIDWRDIDEDYFEFSAFPWMGEPDLSADELALIEEVLAPYV